MGAIKPSAAPNCWGSKYQDGDEECRQCPHSDTCRLAMMERLSSPHPDARVNLPVISSTFPPPPKPQINIVPPHQVIANIPAKTYASSSQVPIKTNYQTYTSPPVNTQSYNHNPTYSTNTTYSLPDPTKPNPLNALHRPGAQSPSYYFTQYPGESVGERLTKNVILRGLEAVFYELMQFFRHWTWPPGI